MGRTEVREALRRAGVPDDRYEIVGLHKAARPDLGFYFLEDRSGQWVVGVQERGSREVMARFDNENDACRFLYDRLTWREPAPKVQTPEEQERGSRATAEMVRRFERQRAERLARERHPDEGER